MAEETEQQKQEREAKEKAQQQERDAKEKAQLAAKAQSQKTRAEREKEAADKRAKMTADQAKVYERVNAKIQDTPMYLNRLLALVKDGMMTEAELANIEGSLPKLSPADKKSADLKAEDENATPRPAEIGLPRPSMRAMQERVIAQLEGLSKNFQDIGDKSLSVELKDDEQSKVEEMADKIALLATHRQRGG